MDKILFEDITPFVRNAKKYIIKHESYPEVANYANLFIYVLTDIGNVIVENITYALERGDVLIIRAGTPMHFLSPALGSACIMIDFDYTMLNKNIKFRDMYDKTEVFNSDKILEKLSFSNLPSFNTTVYLKKMHLLEDKLIEISKEYSNRSVYSELILEGLLKSVLSLVARRQKEEMQENNDKARSVEKVLMYIDEHSCENLTNQTIGKLFGMHPNHVNALVKRETGYTLHNYLLTRRLSHAIKLLDETSIPVYEVSEKCGFSESKNFIRYFKTAVGITPHQYRKRK